MKKNVFVIGGTGFVGQSLIRALLKNGHKVEALVRKESKHTLPEGTISYLGDPLDHATYIRHLKPDHTLVQLAGASHPNPLKKDLFQKIDFVCGRESVIAASATQVENFVYVSVAQPLPMMQAYVKARAGVEELLRASHLSATILRPFYVIGPGRRWPLFLLPLYWIFENQSATREVALRLGFVSIEQMVKAMVFSIENPKPGFRILEVTQIRNVG